MTYMLYTKLTKITLLYKGVKKIDQRNMPASTHCPTPGGSSKELTSVMTLKTPRNPMVCPVQAGSEIP